MATKSFWGVCVPVYIGTCCYISQWIYLLLELRCAILMYNCVHQNAPLPERQTLVPTILCVWFLGDKVLTSSPHSYLQMHEEALSLTHTHFFATLCQVCWSLLEYGVWLFASRLLVWTFLRKIVHTTHYLPPLGSLCSSLCSSNHSPLCVCLCVYICAYFLLTIPGGCARFVLPDMCCIYTDCFPRVTDKMFLMPPAALTMYSKHFCMQVHARDMWYVALSIYYERSTLMLTI